MKSQSEEKKFVPEMPKREIEELRTTIKASSQRIIADYIQRMRKTSANRPEAMQYFDEIANLFGQREKEIEEAKQKGAKVIGYFCNFAPIELVLAADAIPVRVNSGWYDTAKIGDRFIPVEVCPMVRATIGAKMIGLSPFMEQTDALISILTCDGMTKLSEILTDYKPVLAMPVPRVKDSSQSLGFWTDEIKAAKDQIEKLVGNKITKEVEVSCGDCSESHEGFS